MFANTREKVKLVLVVVLARSRLDFNLKVSNNKIGNEKTTTTTNKQATTAAATENKQKTNKTKQNKSGGVREFLGRSEKEKLRSIILR